MSRTVYWGDDACSKLKNINDIKIHVVCPDHRRRKPKPKPRPKPEKKIKMSNINNINIWIDGHKVKKDDWC